jgi:hypothetical protein
LHQAGVLAECCDGKGSAEAGGALVVDEREGSPEVAIWILRGWEWLELGGEGGNVSASGLKDPVGQGSLE